MNKQTTLIHKACDYIIILLLQIVLRRVKILKVLIKSVCTVTGFNGIHDRSLLGMENETELNRYGSVVEWRDVEQDTKN